MLEDGAAGACVLFDGESFSPGSGDATTEFSDGDEMVFGDVHEPVQPATPGGRAFIQRAIQGVAGGRGR